MSPLNLPTPSKEAPRPLRLPGGPKLESFSLELRTVTPILGGAPVPRQLPTVDVIRAPSLRGHLRFWWRALHGHAYSDASRLDFAKRERDLWGGMSLGKEEPRRSLVSLCVSGVSDASPDRASIHPSEPSFYALWPTRNGDGDAPSPRWNPGLRFTLEVRAPEGVLMQEVRNAFRAWVLFGGYGSRTRRGCGSVTLVDPKERESWLPKDASRAELCRLFGDLPFLRPDLAGEPRDLPLLRGARLYRGHRGESNSSGNEAWLQALGWLRDFRQGTAGAPDDRPRNPAPDDDKKRARRSNWPEADKIRHHARPGPRAYPEEHVPREQYTRSPAWPRAGFGLPIVFHFQQKKRGTAKEFYKPAEPEGVQLQWVMDQEREARDRLASPLIVKAMPLANGRFEPIALWLERGYPQGGKVVMVQSNRLIEATRASFDTLHASDDKPLFKRLRDAKSLRDVFFTWLSDTRKAREV
ncbi:RAMP superfamily CRISPR-associated protein [Myxococcus landrumensis]|uniref:CRISPR-associated protein Cmr1 n=1 Tax=Myxococcus landrumensis TaxID=2813577 RepID=A0ABX7N713_9BACT|nr:RAMP superfamily CRISPR-associated protein [Myxococcus landrumus]QSQ12143.1 CRISPR-associated protein Cmr1 [Myxococcus landrumus]